MLRVSATKNLDAAEATALTTHRTADGTSHANVVLNDTHRASNGTDHANVVTNDSHVAGDGSDHADVATNTAAVTGGKGPFVDTEEVAGALAGGPTTINAFIAPAAGTITAVYSKLGTACAAGQTVDIDVQIGGVSALTAATQHDNTDGTNAVAASIDGTADDFVAGDLITVIHTEANGGGPTAADLTVTVGCLFT